MEKIIKELVNAYLAEGDRVESIIPLYGDASYRRYYRVKSKHNNFFIVMKMPPGPASVSEEISNYKGSIEKPPYITISETMMSENLPVPEIFFYDSEKNAIILEDLGDNLFLNHVMKSDDATKGKWYKKAIDLIVDIQKKMENKEECISMNRSFDQALLNWEFDHFLEYGIEKRMRAELPTKVKETFFRITREITDAITDMDYTFTHRDFQSRNLMIKNDSLYVIDFQDALRGPIAYDLVALTRDSYIKLPDELVDELINYFCEKKDIDVDKFRNQYNLITIQRKLKDAGRFVFIDSVKKNPGYLEYIPASLSYVKKAIDDAGYDNLYLTLKDYIPEWKND